MAGNTDATPATYSWMIDTTAAGYDHHQPAVKPHEPDECELRLHGDRDCSVRMPDRQRRLLACTSPKTFTGLAGREPYLQGAVDRPAGNVDATPASYSWLIDTIAPDTTITSQPANPTNQTSAVFTFARSTEAAPFECRIDSGDMRPARVRETTALSASNAPIPSPFAPLTRQGTPMPLRQPIPGLSTLRSWT